MPHFIHTVCGTQFQASEIPPDKCLICADARQYQTGQVPQWITHEALAASHHNTVRQIAPDFIGIGIAPRFGIGQRAILLLHPEGNLLWDCVPLLDAGLVRLIEAAGGLAAIAISHPHYYSSMAEWSHAFGNAPIYLHEDDRQWVMREVPELHFWSGEQYQLRPDLTLVRCGGHFAGATVLHYNQGKGVLLSGDVVQVVADRNYVSFMYSYPNYIPLSASRVDAIVSALQDHEFEQIMGAFWGGIVKNGKQRLVESALRYKNALQGEYPLQ